MPQDLLKRSLAASVREALCSGEMERAEYLCTSLLRLEQKHIDALLENSRTLILHNPCTIHDHGYVPRNYLVTALVSTYKAERFLEERIRDLLGQSIADQLEILVIDTASPQNEADIVRSFQDRCNTIRYFRTDRRESVYQAWNRGVAAARGKYLTNANTDDRLRSDAFERMVAVLEDGADVVYADSLLTTNENETFLTNHAYTSLQRPPFSRNALLESCITGSHPMWRRSLHDEIGYFDTACSSAGDYDFFIRASQNHRFVHVPETLGLVWTSPETFSGRGFLPNMEFYATRERYRDLLIPTGYVPGNPSEQTHMPARLQELAAGGENQAIDDLIHDKPDLCHDFGVWREQQSDMSRAWRYLQRAYYLAPETPTYRDSMQRVLEASLRCSIMDLAGRDDYLLSPDKLMTVALASQVIGYATIAVWCYLTVLEFEPENSASVANLERLFKEASQED